MYHFRDARAKMLVTDFNIRDSAPPSGLRRPERLRGPGSPDPIL